MRYENAKLGIDLEALNKQLEPLELPGFIGTACLSRRVDFATGRAEIDPRTGRPVSCPPYLVVKCGELTDRQETAVTEIVEGMRLVPGPEA